MAVYNLSNLERTFPEYEVAWKVVDAIFRADPDAMVVMMLTRSTACSKAMYEVLKRYRYDNNIDLDFKGSVDDYSEERVSVILTSSGEES